MADYGPDTGDFNPSWMEDGGGLSGGSETDFGLDNDQSYISPRGTVVSAPAWDTTTTSNQNQSPKDGTGGGETVQTGTFSGGYLGIVNGVTTITLDERYFLIQDNGGGEVLISLNTTTCS